MRTHLSETDPRRSAGLILGVWLLAHLFFFEGPWAVAAGAVCGLGLILRLSRRPWRLRSDAVLLATAAAIPFTAGLSAAGAAGLVASWFSSSLLLRPLSARRGLWVVFFSLGLLASLALDPGFDCPSLLIVADVAVLFFAAQQSQAPEGAARGLRQMLVRALSLALPVTAVVTMGFWFFPTLSSRTSAALSGYSGTVNPGDFTELRASRRVACVISFDGTSPVPPAADLYWRGRELVRSEGLRWLQGPRVGIEGSLPADDPGWRYTIEPAEGRVAVPLDRPVEARDASGQGGELDPSGWSVEGPVKAVSTRAPAADPPDERIAAGSLQIPRELSTDARLAELASRLFGGGESVAAKAASLAGHLRTGGYSYSISPGKISQTAAFLLDVKRGYCEHYAAACANLFRLGGIPARVITGYRGGRWNPLLRTITLRDSDAHAWVEIWDASARRWIRFDPTWYVAPELSLRIAAERDEAGWSWLRWSGAAASGLFVMAGRLIRDVVGHSAFPAAVAVLFLAASLLGLRPLFRRRAGDPLGLALERLGRLASARGTPRAACEPPLSWIGRLQRAARTDAERDQLGCLAALYEQAAYCPGGSAQAAELLSLVRKLPSA